MQDNMHVYDKRRGPCTRSPIISARDISADVAWHGDSVAVGFQIAVARPLITQYASQGYY